MAESGTVGELKKPSGCHVSGSAHLCGVNGALEAYGFVASRAPDSRRACRPTAARVQPPVCGAA
eukprot:316482-Amphidinium_carterae.4